MRGRDAQLEAALDHLRGKKYCIDHRALRRDPP
jgi:hypothetical protein